MNDNKDTTPDKVYRPPQHVRQDFGTRWESRAPEAIDTLNKHGQANVAWAAAYQKYGTKAFPRADPADAGWQLSRAAVEMVQANISGSECPGLEEIENTVEALAKLGFIRLEQEHTTPEQPDMSFSDLSPTDQLLAAAPKDVLVPMALTIARMHTGELLQQLTNQPWSDLACQALVEFASTPAEIPWAGWKGGEESPIKDEEVEVWEWCSRDGREVWSSTTKPSKLRWKHIGKAADIVAYRVTKWAHTHGPKWAESLLPRALEQTKEWKEKYEKLKEESAARIADLETRLRNAAADADAGIKDMDSRRCSAVLSLQQARARVAHLEFMIAAYPPGIAILRPIAEADRVPVPPGCTRAYWSKQDGCLGTGRWATDSDFLDFRSPVEAPTEESPAPTETVSPEAPAWVPSCGAVVRLKSHGPEMTVSLIEDGKCLCVWFVGSTVHEHRFAADMLAPQK